MSNNINSIFLYNAGGGNDKKEENSNIWSRTNIQNITLKSPYMATDLRSSRNRNSATNAGYASASNSGNPSASSDRNSPF